MSWKLKLDLNLNIIVTTFSGKVKGDDFIDASNARLEWVENTGITKLLIDVEEMEISNKEVFTIYELVDKHYRDSELNLKMKMAITSSKFDKTNELAHFYETLNINRGYNCRKFDTRDDAIKWLVEG